MGEARTTVYRKGSLEAADFPVADVSEHLDDSDTVVSVDLRRPSKEQDVVVDGYFDSIQAFDDDEDVSDGIFAEQPLEPAQQRYWSD
jgi:hypothetical protein